MRDATPEENEALNKYLKSISSPIYTSKDINNLANNIKQELKSNGFDETVLLIISQVIDKCISEYKPGGVYEDISRDNE